MLPFLLLLPFDAPVEAPRPTHPLTVYVLLDSTPRSAGLRHEITSPHRRQIAPHIRTTVIEWDEVPSFRVPSIPAWRTRYGEWQPVTGCGCGCGLLRIAAGLRTDRDRYEEYLRSAGDISANPFVWERMKRYEGDR